MTSRIRARTIWLKIHLYLALTVGAVIALLGLTGALLVFHPQIDHLLTPTPRAVASAGSFITPDDAVAAIERHAGLPVALIRLPRERGAAYEMELFDERTETYYLARVDSGLGEVLSSAEWGRTFVTFLLELHTSLMLGEPGLIAIGWLGVTLLVSIVTGLYLWWPRRFAFRQAFTMRWTRRALPMNFDLHRLSGVYVSLVLLVIASAGVYFAFPDAIHSAIGTFAQVTPEPAAKPSDPPADGARPLALTQVHSVATTHAGGGRIVSIIMPRAPLDSYEVRYVDRDEPDNRNGLSTVWIDQFTGRVLGAYAYSQLGRADRYLALQLPLHDGDILGLPGRILACIAGLVTAALYGTGLYLWWKRRRPAPRRPENPA